MHDASLSSKDMLPNQNVVEKLLSHLISLSFQKTCKLAFLRKGFALLNVHLFLEDCLGCMVMVEMSGMLPNRSPESRDRWPEGAT